MGVNEIAEQIAKLAKAARAHFERCARDPRRYWRTLRGGANLVDAFTECKGIGGAVDSAVHFRQQMDPFSALAIDGLDEINPKRAAVSHRAEPAPQRQCGSDQIAVELREMRKFTTAVSRSGVESLIGRCEMHNATAIA